MYRVMKSLITIHYYKTKIEVTERLDAFYAFKKLSYSEYEELTELTNSKYEDSIS